MEGPLLNFFLTLSKETFCISCGQIIVWNCLCGGFDLGWMMGAHQSCTITPLLSWTGEGKQNERLVGRGKDREITQQLLSRAKQTQLGEINLIYCQSNQSRVMRIINKSENIFPYPSLLPSLNFTPDFSSSSTSSPREARRDGEWGFWSVHHMLSLPLLPPQGEDSSHSSPAPA